MTIWRVLAVAVLLAAVSCAGAARRLVAVESIDSVGRLGWSGIETCATVRNDLRRDLHLDSCRIVFRVGTGVLAAAELRGGAMIARQSESPVRLRFKIVSDNPSAMQLLWRKMAAGETGDLLLDIDAAVRIGSRERKICMPQRSLSEILRNFGVAEDDFAAWFQ